ncbi:piggyBac transposable element-derived protein 4-like [Ruditapes philippinarum]|uniref:piggyBac transposable element-derived protein 4-like n=1 Tax=Ruditapes philippinarum TaxID=129788 RepID=UPI00295C077C|nr:piggyBac transposable element-derived protein 4-like [Ruditapes philippinarum]
MPDHIDSASALPIEFFLLLFPVELICLITRLTNEYAVWRMSQLGARFDDLWEEVTVHEMRAFLGINILMGINQLPEAKMYWSTDPLIGNTAVSKIMTINRFQQIMKYLHVSDRTTEPTRDQPGFDKLFKVRPVLDSLSDTFRRYFTLHREVSIDEAMVAFAGRLSYRQYMPAKPVKRGIKVWMLCDAQSAYLSRFDIYLGRQENRTEHGLGHNVVMKLSDHLRHSFRWLFFDNFFTGVELMQRLLDVGLYACGTVRTNRKGFPQELKKPSDVRNRGDFKVLQKRNSNLTASVWRDKKPVHHLSTLSDPRMILPVQRQVGPRLMNLQQPHSVSQYNKFMGGVDLQDQFRSTYPVGRNGKKSWRYIFWFLLNSAIVNAWILYSDFSTRTTKKRYMLLTSG